MMTVLTLEDMHDLPDPVDATLGVLRVAVPAAPAYAFNFGDDRGLRAFDQTAAHHMAKRNLDLATLGCMSYTPTGKARMVAILDCPILFPFAVASACRSVRSAGIVLTCAPSVFCRRWGDPGCSRASAGCFDGTVMMLGSICSCVECCIAAYELCERANHY
jgi:hypothetical protein